METAGLLPLQGATIDRRRATRPQIHDLLYDAIISVALRPGQVVSKNDLSRVLGVSRTPIQEALLKLENEGLVDIYPQSGTYVSRMRVQDIEEALFLRRTIEPAVIEQFCAAASPDEIQALETHVSAQAKALEDGEYARLWQLDGEFHKSLCKHSGLGGVWRVIHGARVHLARIRNLSAQRLDGARTAIEEHRRILECIARQDAAGAAGAMRDHTDLNLHLMHALIDRFPDYFEVRKS